MQTHAPPTDCRRGGHTLDTVASPIPHRVLLLENHPLLRESLPALLHEQMPGLAMEQCSSVYGAIELLPVARTTW